MIRRYSKLITLIRYNMVLRMFIVIKIINIDNIINAMYSAKIDST